MSGGSGKGFRVRRWFNSQRAEANSEKKRVILVVVAVLASMFLGGTFMGIASLQSVWVKQGRYLSLCENVTASEEPPIQVLPDATCKKQASKISAIYHFATGATFGAISNSGLLTDWLGARRIYGVTLSLLILGNIIASVPGYWTQFIGTVLMSAMGPCVAFTLLVWAQLTPHATHWVVALITAAFPGGSYILALLRLAVLRGALSISSFYALWLCASLPALYLFVIWPKGVGKPYAAAHPLLMLSQVEFLKNIMQKLHIPIPEDTNTSTMVELEERYTLKSHDAKKTDIESINEAADEEQVELDFDAMPSPSEYSRTQDGLKKSAENGSSATKAQEAAKEAKILEIEVKSSSEPSVALDTENGISDLGKELQLKEVKWVAQIMAPSIALIQVYFLLVSVWLAVVSNQGSSRLTYWARKTSSDQTVIDARIAQAKAFLPNVDFINALTIAVSPAAALILHTVGITGLSIITHVIVTISALLCLIPSFSVQILNYYLFAAVRGLMYPFAMMFLIQVCGRRHLGLLWGMTVGGAGPTEIIGTLLNKYWLFRPNAWDVLNGVQMVPVMIAWILPIYIWVRQEKLEDTHPEPLA
jgi:hypothetical protein